MRTAVAVENHRTTAQLLARGFPAARRTTWATSQSCRGGRSHLRGQCGRFRVGRMSCASRLFGLALPFVVYAMHLGNPLFKTTYTQHAEMVERLVAAAQAESLPVVLAGDFNMSDRSASYRELGGAFRDAIRTSFADTTYDDGLWMLLQLRIDYIFVSRSLCARSATTFTVPGSDHDGLEVEIGTRSS